MRFEKMPAPEAIAMLSGTGLMEACFARTVRNAPSFKLDVEWYREASDCLRCVLAFDGEGKLVGFCSVFITQHQHTDTIYATNDAIYVLPGHPLIGGALIREAERMAKEAGAERFIWETPIGGALEKALKKRPAYVPQQMTFEKEL
jgi:hypothetical protein